MNNFKPFARYIATSLAAGMSLLLAACGDLDKPAEVSAHAVNFTTRQAAVVKQIKKSGAEIVQQGSRLQIILPIDDFFRSGTLNIKEDQVQNLQIIALYLHNFIAYHPTRFPIKVFGYADTVYSRAERKRLSLQHAKVIAAFMWKQSFSPRQLQVKGYGAKDAIATNKTPQGAALNRRVLIQVN